MATTPRYFCNVSRLPRIRPNDGIPAVGVMADPAVPKSIIGIAYPYSYFCNSRSIKDPQKTTELPEVLWQVVLDRRWIDHRIQQLATKIILPGQFVIRHGEFHELVGKLCETDLIDE